MVYWSAVWYFRCYSRAGPHSHTCWITSYAIGLCVLVGSAVHCSINGHTHTLFKRTSTAPSLPLLSTHPLLKISKSKPLHWLAKHWMGPITCIILLIDFICNQMRFCALFINSTLQSLIFGRPVHNDCGVHALYSILLAQLFSLNNIFSNNRI